MRFVQLAPTSTLLLVAVGCGASAPAVPRAESLPITTTRAYAPEEPARSPEGLPAQATWPTSERFAETAAALGRPFRLVRVRRGDEALLALARREGDAWILGGLLGAPYDAPRPPGCESFPCPWPSSLVPESPLEEQPQLPEHVLSAIIYARTLLGFEGPLDVREQGEGEAQEPEGLPAEAWAEAAPGQGPDLAPFLERLRRYHPTGYCSMDTRPQQVAMMRATAAAQAGRTGWAVQGWIDTVGYWSSSRMVWSSYGQNHPSGHLALLEMVGVDPQRLLLGLLFDFPGQRAALHLADVRRVVPDLGESFVAELRDLAANPAIDPLNRAILFASFAELPFSGDPLYVQLPPESQALLGLWSR